MCYNCSHIHVYHLSLIQGEYKCHTSITATAAAARGLCLLSLALIVHRLHLFRLVFRLATSRRPFKWWMPLPREQAGEEAYGCDICCCSHLQ